MGLRINASIMGSMIAVFSLVNAFAVGASSVEQNSNDKSFIMQMKDYLTTWGDKGRIGEHLAPILGLPGSCAANALQIFNKGKGREIDSLNCALIFDESPHSNARQPVCLIFMRHFESGKDRRSDFYKVDLDGKLLKAILSTGNNDENGKAVAGSAKDTNLDIDSRSVKKSFVEVMKDAKVWLKKQQKDLAAKEKAKSKTTPAPAEPASAKP